MNLHPTTPRGVAIQSDLFDPSGQSKASMAVKLALGETHIIQQTKQMLEDEVGG